MTVALAISLFATICIDGTLHGLPKTLCREFQLAPVGGYETVAKCEKVKDITINSWLLGIQFLQPHLVAERCGPAEPDADGDDI